jgi:hypothetical protein
MANNTISLRNQQLFDPGALQQSIPYQINGLTYRSNDTNVHPRDEAGNIILQENSETNPLLIIEPVAPNIINSTILRVIDTTFRYFKFPVAIDINALQIATEDLELDLSAIEFDGIYARYKPSADFEPAPTGGTYSGISMDEVVDGLPKLDSGYTVSKDVKSSGKNLRFRIKIAHRYDSSSPGTVFWSIIKNGPNYPLKRDWKAPYASYGNQADIYQTIQTVLDAAWTLFDIDTGFGDSKKEDEWKNRKNAFKDDEINAAINASKKGLTILTSEQKTNIEIGLATDAKDVPSTSNDVAIAKIQNMKVAYTNYQSVLNSTAVDLYGLISNTETQYTYIDETILNSEFEIGDVFGIGVKTDNTGHEILNAQTYWVITDASKNVDEWNQEIIE